MGPLPMKCRICGKSFILFWCIDFLGLSYILSIMNEDSIFPPRPGPQTGGHRITWREISVSLPLNISYIIYLLDLSQTFCLFQIFFVYVSNIRQFVSNIAQFFWNVSLVHLLENLSYQWRYAQTFQVTKCEFFIRAIWKFPKALQLIN